MCVCVCVCVCVCQSAELLKIDLLFLLNCIGFSLRSSLHYSYENIFFLSLHVTRYVVIEETILSELIRLILVLKIQFITLFYILPIESFNFQPR